MTYKLDNIDISEYGAIPITKNQYLALEGVFDLPKRTGTTEYNWGTSIEPYLDAEDIKVDGRTLTLNIGILKKDGNFKNKIQAFISACVSCRTLSTEYDDFSVYCKDDIKVEEYDSFALITVKFWQNDFVLKQLSVQPSNSGRYRVDEYNLEKDFGIFISNKESLESIAKRIESQTTDFYKQTQYRDILSVKLDCSVKGKSIFDLYNKITQFQSLCYSPGEHILKLIYEDFSYHVTVFFKSGFQVKIPAENILTFSFIVDVIEVSHYDTSIRLKKSSNSTLRITNTGLQFI